MGRQEKQQFSRFSRPKKLSAFTFLKNWFQHISQYDWLWPNFAWCYLFLLMVLVPQKNKHETCTEIRVSCACFTIAWFTTRKQAWFQCFNARQRFHLSTYTEHTRGSTKFVEEEDQEENSLLDHISLLYGKHRGSREKNWICWQFSRSGNCSAIFLL